MTTKFVILWGEEVISNKERKYGNNFIDICQVTLINNHKMNSSIF
jgi:hypothetical protein